MKNIRAVSTAIAIVAVAFTAIAEAGTIVDSGSGVFSVGYTEDGANWQVIYGAQHVNMIENPVVEVTGAISNWDAWVDVSGDKTWCGLWSSFGMIGADFFVNGDPAQGYTHLGEDEYGDTSHQMGMGSNATLTPWADGGSDGSWDIVPVNGMTIKAEDTEERSSKLTLTPVHSLMFKMHYDVSDSENQWMSSSISTDGGANWQEVGEIIIGDSNKSGEFDDWSDTIFFAVAANDASWDTPPVGYRRSMGYDLTYTVTVVPEPSTAILLSGGLFGLLAYAWRKRKAHS